jgi:hypothetical protein
MHRLVSGVVALCLSSANDAVKVRLPHACPADEFNNTEDAQVSGIEYKFGSIIMVFNS